MLDMQEGAGWVALGRSVLAVFFVVSCLPEEGLSHCCHYLRSLLCWIPGIEEKQGGFAA